MTEQIILEKSHFEQMEKEILEQVMEVSKSMIESFKFRLIYGSKVTPEQNQRTLKALQEFRDKNWDTSVSKKEAYKKYLSLYD